MTFIEQLHESIDRRLQELRAEIAKIEDARRALANGSAKLATAEPDRVEATPRTRPQKQGQKTRVLTSGQLQQILSESADGLSTAVIAQRGHAEPSQVLALLRELEKAAEVRRSGERRGTRWHLITEEDRIASEPPSLPAAARPRRLSKRLSRGLPSLPTGRCRCCLGAVDAWSAVACRLVGHAA